MILSAEIYIGEDRILVQSNDELVARSGSTMGSYLQRLSHSASVDQILLVVEEALANCKTDIPLSPDLKARILPLLAATGEKTWNAITRSFAYVGVTKTDKTVVFYSGFPEKGSFIYTKEAHWRCAPGNQAEAVTAFRAAAAVAIEAQNLRNPPPLP